MEKRMKNTKTTKRATTETGVGDVVAVLTVRNADKAIRSPAQLNRLYNWLISTACGLINDADLKQPYAKRFTARLFSRKGR